MLETDTRTVRQERSGWRDLSLSERHRQWGWHCPAVDVDFLFLEYDRGKAGALVEYKHERAMSVRDFHPSVRAMIDLGDRAALPVFTVRYASDFAWWHVRPLNAHARKWLAEAARLTEREWVELLYRIRGRELPPSCFDADDGVDDITLTDSTRDRLRKRPRIDLFDDCLPDRIGFAGLAGVLEVNGRLLALEWQSCEHIPSTRHYERWSSAEPSTVLLIVGDAEAMTVERLAVVHEGIVGPWRDADVEGVRDEIRAWVKWARVQASCPRMPE